MQTNSSSQAQDQAFWGFDEFFNADEKTDGFGAVDDAVVVAQGDVHHWADDDLAVDGHRAIFDRVHSEDAALRWVDDRRRHQAAVGATVGDGEGAALHVVDGELAFAGFKGVAANRFLDVGKGHVLGVLEDRHHQALFGADGDTDIDVVERDHIGAINLAVDAGIFFQRLHRSDGKYRHKAQADAVLLFEVFLPLLAQIHGGAHVDLVKGGQDRGGVLGLDEALCDALAQGAHAFA